MDRFSPVAPACIRVLVLPVGETERSKFLAFLSRLQDEASIISLSDIRPYIDEDELLLSPKAFPQGSLLYNYTSSVPNQTQAQLSPFELFREPLLVLGAIDGLRRQDEDNTQELAAAAEYLRERHPRVVHRQLIILGETGDEHAEVVDGVIRVANAGQTGSESLNEAACQISARFLKELATYTRAMQASPSIQTPGQTARSLQRTASQRDQDRRPASGHHTPSRSEAASPVDENRSKPLPHGRSSPATSFDQIPSANNVSSGISRPDSQTSNRPRHNRRASSQDRVSVQGFGSGSQDKLKQRGKARVGIVIGSIYMIAGQWSEALRTLTEHTNKARILSDHIWHAKGLESIIVCLMLHSWAGVEFQIPSICYPVSERTSSAHVQRFSVNLPSDFRPAEIAQQASVRRLSTSLPDLLKLVLSLYRSLEGSLELPPICICDATLRFSKLLAMLHSTGGELDPSILDHFILRTSAVGSGPKRTTSSPVATTLSKAAISDMLSHAMPTMEDSMPITDQVAILAGVASVYNILRMHRKRGSVLTELVAKLTTALTQARKRGAVEAGIYSATTSSAENGTEAILSITGESGGVIQMMSELARIYGIELPTSTTPELELSSQSFFGSERLKISLLNQFAAFCEASPDPRGLLQVTTTMLRSLGPTGAADTETIMNSSVLSTDDPMRLTTTINRTIGTAKHHGLPWVEARYWDQFLVRGVEFVFPSPDEAIIDRSKLKSAGVVSEQGTKPGNPLLYDPNASRPGTAEARQVYTLVENEPSTCIVTLQNPYEMPVEIESLSLITEGAELQTSHTAITLHPLRLQQVAFPVYPGSVGDCKITGCRVKISGCFEQTFPIVEKPWAPVAPTLMKGTGQEDQSNHVEQKDAPEHLTVLATVIEAQPLLALETSSLLESNIMLLDGEKKELNVIVRNVSNIGLSIFEVVTSNGALHLQQGLAADGPRAAVANMSPDLTEQIVIGPGDEFVFKVLASGRPTIARSEIAFYYSRKDGGGAHARLLSVPIDMTVNAAVQIQHFDVMPSLEDDDDEFTVSFDLRNAWPKSLSYVASAVANAEPNSAQGHGSIHDGLLVPGEVQRVHLSMPRLDHDPSFAGNLRSVRQSLFERLQVTWSGEGRVGEVDLSGLTITSEAVATILKDPINVSIHIIESGSPSNRSAPSSKHVVKAGSFVTLRAALTNRAAASEPLFLQLQSRLADIPDSTLNERQVAVAGSTRRIVPILNEGQEVIVDFALCPLLSGQIELEVTAMPALAKSGDRRWSCSRSLLLRVT